MKMGVSRQHGEVRIMAAVHSIERPKLALFHHCGASVPHVRAQCYIRRAGQAASLP